MGYYSDVYFKIEMNTELITPAEVFDDLKDRMKAVDSWYMINNCILKPNYEEGYLVVGWESIKWYTGELGFAEINAVEDWFKYFVDMIDDNNDNSVIKGAQKIIIGEDYNDTVDECYGVLDNYMYINRSVDLNI